MVGFCAIVKSYIRSFNIISLPAYESLMRPVNTDGKWIRYRSTMWFEGGSLDRHRSSLAKPGGNN
jgi:hypothetical protein